MLGCESLCDLYKVMRVLNLNTSLCVDHLSVLKKFCDAY